MFHNYKKAGGTIGTFNQLINQIMSRGNEVWLRRDGNNPPTESSDWHPAKGAVFYEDEIISWENEIVWFRV